MLKKIEVSEIFFEVLDQLRQADEIIHDNMSSGDNSYIYKRIEEYKSRFLKALDS